MRDKLVGYNYTEETPHLTTRVMRADSSRSSSADAPPLAVAGSSPGHSFWHRNCTDERRGWHVDTPTLPAGTDSNVGTLLSLYTATRTSVSRL